MTLDKLDDRLSFAVKKYSLDHIKNQYDRITSAYKSNRKIIITSEVEALAYALMRMPATATVLKHVLQHLKGQADEINTALDLGCGPGSILASLEERLSLKEATLIDQSSALLNMGQRLFSDYKNLSVEWRLDNLKSLKIEGSFDLVIISYVLNELSIAEQASLIQQAWDLSQRFVVIVEPGTPAGFSHIKQARQRLIDWGASIIAPCAHTSPCPMSESDWCHFKARVERGELHRIIKGHLPYEDEKYSFLIVSKDPYHSPFAYRIVKKPLHSSGLVELALCGANGLASHKFSKRDKGEYKLAKKLKWGEGF